MQVATDPVALLDDRVVGGLLVQPSVLDGDARMEGEELDEPLVGRRVNSAAPALSVR